MDASDRYSAFFEQVPFGVIVYDLDLTMVDCNEALAVFLGTTRERVVGWHLNELPDKRALPALLEALEGGKGKYVGEYTSITSGRKVVFIVRSLPLRDSAGTIIGGLAIIEDATERVQAERTLRDQVATLEQQSETIRTLGTPVLKVWDGILCVPVIGELDDRRATDLAESALVAITRERARFLIVDLTGLTAVDTFVAQHLTRLFQAAAFLGAEVLVCGTRPEAAQAFTSLDVALKGVRTTQTLHDALQRFLARIGEATARGA